MFKKLRGGVSALHGWIWSLPIGGVITAGVITAGTVGAGGYYAYKTYDWVEHDNDFCMSCHLMAEPYELFAESAHRGLGCKACHQPSMVERSTMALTQVVENPDELSVHAEVPNERCETCHIEGDPERWRLVENSVGHRIHLESEDSTLSEIGCVECHQSSLHQFTATDETCAQSGCHTDSQVQLGAMSDLTIHCAACHGFSTPIEDDATPEAFADAIQPDRDTCLSCHEMRALVTMPDPDPHLGSCGSCHNPHEQETPQAAAESCATAGCHSAPDTLTAFHRGIDHAALDDCASCHTAHDFALDGDDCASCHTDIYDTPPVPVGSIGREASAAVGVGWWAHSPRRGVGDVGLGEVVSVGVESDGNVLAESAQEALLFAHAEHRDVACASCHESAESHGAVTVSTVADCRSCHHTEPTSNDCAACHVDSGVTGQTFTATRTVDFSVHESTTDRALPFDHADHAAESCATCHTEGLPLSAASADCASCHEEHHEPTLDCRSCHQAAPVEAHPVDQAHVTCSGAGCHTPPPFETIPREPTVCLGCHQDMADHRPGQDCAECHALEGGGVG